MSYYRSEKKIIHKTNTRKGCGLELESLLEASLVYVSKWQSWGRILKRRHFDILLKIEAMLINMGAKRVWGNHRLHNSSTSSLMLEKRDKNECSSYSTPKLSNDIVQYSFPIHAVIIVPVSERKAITLFLPSTMRIHFFQSHQTFNFMRWWRGKKLSSSASS